MNAFKQEQAKNRNIIIPRTSDKLYPIKEKYSQKIVPIIVAGDKQ